MAVFGMVVAVVLAALLSGGGKGGNAGLGAELSEGGAA